MDELNSLDNLSTFEVLSKPYTSTELLNKLTALLDKK